MLDQLIPTLSQARGTPVLDQLIRRKDLTGYLVMFLLSCKVQGLSPDTIRAYRGLVGYFIRFIEQGGVTHPAQVAPDHIRLFLLKQQETCNSISIRTYYRHIKRFFNWLVEERALTVSPMAVIKPPKASKPLIVPFQESSLRRLLFLCDDSTFLGARNKAIILVLTDTGLRLKEIAEIQKSVIDFDRETIKVMGKGAKERVVRIGENTQRAILRYLLRRDDTLPCLWVTEERHLLTKWGIEIMIRKLGKRAEPINVRCSPHMFRHTFATDALENGAAEWEVQSLLGHETLEMTRRYTNTLRSQKAIIGHKKLSPVDNLKLE